MSDRQKLLRWELVRLESMLKHYASVEWKLRQHAYLKSETIVFAQEAVRARRSTILKQILAVQLEEFDRG